MKHLTPPAIRIRTKLMGLTALLATLVILLVVTFVSRNMKKVILEETQKRALAIAQLFGATNLNYLKEYNFFPIRRNALAAKSENDLLYVVVYDKEHRVIADTEDPGLLFPQPVSDSMILKFLSSKITSFREAEVPDRSSGSMVKVLEVWLPVIADDSHGPWGIVRIVISSEKMLLRLRETQIHILQIGIASLVFGLFGAALLAARIATPIAKLMEGSLRAASGDLSSHIHVKSGDELESLAENFNYMMDQIKQNQEDRIKAEKMAAVGSMVNTIVHDCRTPITVIKGFTSLLTEFKVTPEKERECLNYIIFEVERMEKMLDEILHFASEKRSRLTLEDQSLDDFIKECCVEIDALFRNTGIQFMHELNCAAIVRMDKDKLRRAILNIVMNARDALKGSGIFRLTTEDGPQYATIRLSDNGSGIPLEIREKIFDPFFTQGKSLGFGLGMSITKEIVNDHNGVILLESETGKGTTFLVQIPLASMRVRVRKAATSS